jgi:pimeloyl-ACP methyl ester carboxylesterase
VVAVDFPAHGQSDVPGGTVDRDVLGDTVRQTVGSLADVVAELLAALGLERATLVGHSLGGAVALQVATRQPDRVARLVLVDSAGLGREVSTELVRLLDAPPGTDTSRALLQLFFEDQRLVLDAGVAEHEAAMARPGAHAAIGALRRDAFGDDGGQAVDRETLARVTQPVLVVWGERDRVFPAAHADRVQELLPGAEVRIVAGAGHVPQVEDPAAFAAILREFLARTGV